MYVSYIQSTHNRERVIIARKITRQHFRDDGRCVSHFRLSFGVAVGVAVGVAAVSVAIGSDVASVNR
jgi:hypothetical protein